MKLNNNKTKYIEWTARILALAILLFGLPFYFGYGNPLPFTNPDNSLMDNIWLSVFPLMFIGLGLGWKYEKIGSYIIILPIMIATIISIILIREFIPGPMYLPLFVGILYFIVGSHKE